MGVSTALVLERPAFKVGSPVLVAGMRPGVASQLRVQRLEFGSQRLYMIYGSTAFVFERPALVVGSLVPVVGRSAFVVEIPAFMARSASMIDCCCEASACMRAPGSCS